MKISHKITFVSSTLFGAVFLLVALVIYWAFDKSSKNIFYGELARTAKIAAMFYLEEDELTKVQFQPIADAFYNLSPDQKISIYDEQDSTAFDTEKNRSKTAIPRLNEIRRKESLNFKDGQNYYHGLFYRDNQGDFVVLVKAQSPLIQSQLDYLLFILLISFLFGMGLLVLLTTRFSKLAYNPVRHIIRQVSSLDLAQKPLRLDYKSTKDELEELFGAFNTLLGEIEQTYEQQKNFVDYASHELKTPLAGMISRLEVILKRERTTKEYKETAYSILEDAERLQDILKNLLVFSSLNRVIHRKEDIRIDELIWEVLEQLSKKYTINRFRVEIQVPPDAYEYLSFKANQTLLQVALYNLIDNAAKFSEEKPILIKFSKKADKLILQIIDQGVGIDQADLAKIDQPFFRASNVTNFEGSGLGVSIALRILELHDIKCFMESEKNKGTQVELRF